MTSHPAKSLPRWHYRSSQRNAKAQRAASQTSAAAPATIRYQAKGAKPWREM